MSKHACARKIRAMLRRTRKASFEYHGTDRKCSHEDVQWSTLFAISVIPLWKSRFSSYRKLAKQLLFCKEKTTYPMTTYGTLSYLLTYTIL